MISNVFAIHCAEKSSADAVRGETIDKSRSNASLSRKAMTIVSSSVHPSSNATTPKRVGVCTVNPSRSNRTSPASITAQSLAAVAVGSRSAIANNNTLPSHSANNPFCKTGRPLASVAGKSNPPSRRSSVIDKGMRRNDATPNKLRSKVNQISRTGPAPARKRTPPVPTGSSANSTATCTARCQIICSCSDFS